MNQKSNTLKIDFNLQFETSLEMRALLRWLVPVTIALIQFTIRLYGGS